MDYQARGVLYIPDKARFSNLIKLPEGADIGKAINDAMRAVEAENEDLKDVLPKTYNTLDNSTLVDHLKTFNSIPMDIEGDAFGKIYEYFLGGTLWFFEKGKARTDKKDNVLFIDARHIYRQIDRARREFTPEQIDFIAGIVRLYRGESVAAIHESPLQEKFPKGKYHDVPGLCKVATLKEIEAQGWNLNPGRYVGVTERAADDFDFCRATGGNE